jgi:sRNA-binding protein
MVGVSVVNLKRLVDAYPIAFDLENPKPLALGIHKQLTDGFKPGCGYRLVGGYTKRRKYLQALASPSSYRINLDGTIASPVSREHAEYALTQLRKRKPDFRSKTETGKARAFLTLNKRTEAI